ncbi:MAG: Shedu anti-phage system protein SduA domain-containing protein, partial [Parvibaculaceae bacterium]
ASMTETATDVLKYILAIGGDPVAMPKKRTRAPTPNLKALIKLCELLAKNSEEESYQRLLEEHVGFLTGVYGSNDNSDLAVLFKPQIGTQYRADFCVLQVSQGGATAHLIEIESGHDRLFTKGVTPARKLQGALGQIHNWRDWIEKNRAHYSTELIRVAKELPRLGEASTYPRGLRFHTPEVIESHWNAFGGSECFYSYCVVLGRWSTLLSKEKQRLIAMNRHSDDTTIYTYEQLARQATYRDARDEF